MEYYAKNNKLTKNRMPYNGFIIAFISEDYKGKALSGADFSLRSSQFRQAKNAATLIEFAPMPSFGISVSYLCSS